VHSSAQDDPQPKATLKARSLGGKTTGVFDFGGGGLVITGGATLTFSADGLVATGGNIAFQNKGKGISSLQGTEVELKNVQGVSNRYVKGFSIRKIRDISVGSPSSEAFSQDPSIFGGLKREAQAFFDFEEEFLERLQAFLDEKNNQKSLETRVGGEIDLAQKHMEFAVYVYDELERIQQKPTVLDALLKGLLKKRLEVAGYYKEKDVNEEIEGMPSRAQHVLDGIQFISRMIKAIFEMMPIEDLSPSTKKHLRVSPSLWPFLRGINQDEGDLKTVGEDLRLYADHIETTSMDVTLMNWCRQSCEIFVTRADTHPDKVKMLPVLDWLTQRQPLPELDEVEDKESAVVNDTEELLGHDALNQSLEQSLQSQPKLSMLGQLEGRSPDPGAVELLGVLKEKPLKLLALPMEHDAKQALARDPGAPPRSSAVTQLSDDALNQSLEQSLQSQPKLSMPGQLVEMRPFDPGVEALWKVLNLRRLKLLNLKVFDARVEEFEEKELVAPEYVAPRGVRKFHAFQEYSYGQQDLSKLGKHLKTHETIWDPKLAGKGFNYGEFAALWQHIHGKKAEKGEDTIVASGGTSHRALKNAKGVVMGGTFAHNNNQTYGKKTVRYLQDALYKSGYGPRNTK